MVTNGAMITLHDVHKFYGKQDVLRGVDLHVGPNMRLGLVGPNGAGKSTLLGLMLGQIEPDQGSVFRAKNLRMGYLPQDLLKLTGRTILELATDTGDSLAEVEAELEQVHAELANEKDPQAAAELMARQGQLQSVFENLGGYDLESRAQRVLAGLGFRQEQLDREVSELSGGWLMRAALARILLSAPDVILLDEPTNHLDMESLLWLENQLTQMPCSLVLVSHDRVFLDKVVNRIVEVDEGRIFVYGGGYSEYEQQRASRRKAQQAAYDAQQERIREMERFIERNRSRKSSAAQVQGRIKALEKMERLKPPHEDESISLELPPADRSAKVVVELLDVDLAYGPKQVYKGLNFIVERGDRVVLLGRNGAGKSSLLRLLTGAVEPTGGRRLVGGRVKMGVFNQHAMEDLDPERDALTELSTVAGMMPQSRQRAILGAFLFRGDDVFKKVKVLSGGERSRLTLAKLLIARPNFLLLDEPTNHLDLTSRMVLERALQEYDGTLVLISHDRHLVNIVANKIAHVEEGRVTLLPGNFDDFQRLWKKRLPQGGLEPEPLGPGEPAAPLEQAGEADAAGAKKSAEQKRREAQARNELYRKLKPLRDDLAQVERQLAQATAAVDELVAEMVAPQAYADADRWRELSTRHHEAVQRLEKVSQRWERVALELEELEARHKEL